MKVTAEHNERIAKMTFASVNLITWQRWKSSVHRNL